MRWLLLLPLQYQDTPEKDKLKDMPVRESWMHTRWYALVFCGLFFVCGLITIFDMPALTESGVVKPVYHAAIGFSGLLLGLPVVFFLLHSALDTAFFDGDLLYLIPTLPERLLDMVVLCAMTVALFLLVRRLQRFRRVFKWSVYLNYLALVVVLVQQGITPPGDNLNMQVTTSFCEYFMSDTIGIRASNEAHNTQYSELTTFSVTNDSGQTWRKFMLSTANANRLCMLRNTGELNDQFFWLWQWNEAVFTHDGGVTWSLWKAYERDGNDAFWGGACHIEDISFTDEQNGTMTCNYFETTGFLNSNDGGLTWQR